MSNKTIITHVAAEAAVVGALTVYLLNRIATLEQRLGQLELELQIVARKTSRTEENHARAIREIVSVPRPSIIAPPGPPSVPVYRANPSPPGVPKREQKKVTFSDVESPEDEDEDALMAREFSSHSRREEEISEEDDETSEEPVKPPPPTRVTKTPKGRKPSRRAIVSDRTQPHEKNKRSSDMDEVRANAERLRREAGADVE